MDDRRRPYREVRLVQNPAYRPTPSRSPLVTWAFVSPAVLDNVAVPSLCRERWTEDLVHRCPRTVGGVRPQMGVGVQRFDSRSVTKALLDNLDRLAVTDEQARVKVSEVVEGRAVGTSRTWSGRCMAKRRSGST